MVNGLPAHVLLVHAVVVLVPLAALLAVVAAVWPAARRRLGFLTPLVALLALAGVPLATEAGEWLEEHVPESPLVEQHASHLPRHDHGAAHEQPDEADDQEGHDADADGEPLELIVVREAEP